MKSTYTKWEGISNLQSNGMLSELCSGSGDCDFVYWEILSDEGRVVGRYRDRVTGIIGKVEDGHWICGRGKKEELGFGHIWLKVPSAHPVNNVIDTGLNCDGGPLMKVTRKCYGTKLYRRKKDIWKRIKS